MPYFSAVDETITYTLTATNTGNVTLTAVDVEDPLLGELDCTPVIPATLEAGASLTCTGTYDVTADDLAYGGIDNSATATGLAPDEETEVSSEASLLIPSVTPRLSVVKTASPETYSTVNELITFTILVSNVGNVSLDNVAVTDSWGALTLDCDPAASGVTLDILENITCTASYRTTGGDLTIGELTNSASATGQYQPDGGDPIDVDDTASVTVYREGSGPTPTPTPTPPAPSPEPSQTPTPTPTATPSPRPTPTSSPAPAPAPAPERLPQVPRKALPVPAQVSPFGTSVLLPATVITNAGQKAKVRVDCTIPAGKRGLVPVLLSPTAPKGDLRLCLVKRGKGGKVSVTVLFPPPVKVTMTLTAPAKGKYGPYKKVISYTTRAKKR